MMHKKSNETVVVLKEHEAGQHCHCNGRCKNCKCKARHEAEHAPDGGGEA